MKIVIRNVDNVVVHAGNDLVLSDTCLTGADWRSDRFTSANATLLEAELPAGWRGGVWAYQNGEWVVHDAPAYAAVLAAARQVSVPRTVTRRQARQALLLRGKLALVQPAIDAIADVTQRGLMQIEWDDSLSFDRDRPSLIAIGAAVGYDSGGLDDIFIFANTL
jgi:hypothetical protein